MVATSSRLLLLSPSVSRTDKYSHSRHCAKHVYKCHHHCYLKKGERDGNMPKQNTRSLIIIRKISVYNDHYLTTEQQLPQQRINKDKHYHPNGIHQHTMFTIIQNCCNFWNNGYDYISKFHSSRIEHQLERLLSCVIVFKYMYITPLEMLGTLYYVSRDDVCFSDKSSILSKCT